MYNESHSRAPYVGDDETRRLDYAFDIGAADVKAGALFRIAVGLPSGVSQRTLFAEAR